MNTTTPPAFRLLSSGMIHTPGVLKYLQAMYQTDPAKALESIAAG